ncbi:DUF1552 domain-containing protein [Gemmatimonadota bacterium DH-20]|uniref:DUF1552 domain-containing protein n=1 Tax=Gaopeijia maritima TaxID=3119007 RepID=A0ABU9E886_9BACT
MHLIGRHIPRRTFLQGMGAAVALPFLDAMRPAGALRALERGAATDPTRLVAIEMVHGSAGSNELGATLNLWSPAATGRDFDLAPSSLRELEAYRHRMNIYSNTDVRMAEAMSAEEIGGDHFRSSAVFLTQAHPKQTEGSDVLVGPSLDQLYAQRFGQETPIPSMQLCIENIDQSGGCAYGYTCVYTDSISWASETEPLPVIRDPRVVFEQLFGAGSTAEERASRLRADRSILDWITGRISEVRSQLGGADRQRLERYLDNVREVERRIQRIEAYNTSGEERALPMAPAGVPDSFREHVELMFDLQALAFQSDMTRVFSFKMGRDSSARVYPESGSERPFHPASHHGGREDAVLEFAKINSYHVSMLPYFLKKLEEISEGDETMLDKTMIIYGSPMGDSNLHNHKRCPLIVLGGANGSLDTGYHHTYADGTPMANVMLSLMHNLGMDDLQSFGDSTGVEAI